MRTAVGEAAGWSAAEPTEAEFADWNWLAADPSAVAGEWADEAMSAAFREANRAAFSLLRWIREAAHASSASTVRVAQRRRPGKIPAASLGWSEGFGAARIELAREVLERLPRLGAEMESGRLEEYKARIFTSTLADLDDKQARVVVDRLVSRAPGWSYQQLRERVESEAKAVDESWAEARRAAAIARRRVVFGIEPSGAAALRALDLPLDPAQDSHDRIVALAAVVADRLRVRGREVGKGQVEAEVLLVLTGPAGVGLWDEDVVELVLDRLDRGTDPGDGGPEDGGPGDGGPADGSDGDGPDDDQPDGGPAADRPDDCGDPDGGDPDGGGPDDSRPDDHHPDDGDGPDDDRPDGGGAADDSDAPPDLPPDAVTPENSTGAEPRRVVPFLARPAVRVGLRTVLGFDRRPGFVPGMGSVCSSTARALAWDRTDATWRLILYDADGRLDHVLNLRPPRAGPPGAGGRRRRHVVELTGYTAEVDDLAAILDPDAEVPRSAVDVVPGHVLEVIRRAEAALADARARPPGEHPAVSHADAARRMPGTALRLWVLYRDLTCRGMGCSKPATVADVDHTHDHVRGGQTLAGNLGPFCAGDHRFKHDPDTGWTVVQSVPGRFDWTAPTGRGHTLTPEPYDPPPGPVRRADGSASSVPSEVLVGVPTPRSPFTPRRNRHGHITEAAREAAEYLQRRSSEKAGRPDPATADQDEGPPF